MKALLLGGFWIKVGFTFYQFFLNMCQVNILIPELILIRISYIASCERDTAERVDGLYWRSFGWGQFIGCERYKMRQIIRRYGSKSQAIFAAMYLVLMPYQKNLSVGNLLCVWVTIHSLIKV